MKNNHQIILGSAQFGNKYGFDNKLCSFNETNKILKTASKLGVKEIDTALAYKNLYKLSNYDLKSFKIILKVNIQKFNKNEFHKNILKISGKIKNKINTILIHNQNFTKLENSEKIFKELLNLKKKKLFSKIGISIYDVELIPSIIKKFKLDIIQVPFNFFDRRINKKKILSILKKNKVKIHVRSIFLQGLLLKHKTPQKFSKFRKELKLFNNFVKKNKISKFNACLNFIFSYHFYEKVVVGVNSKKELEQILNFKKNKNLIFPNLKKIDSKELIDPRKWK